MSVLTSLTRFSLCWSSSRRALSVLALLLAAPGYSCQADQPSPARVEVEKEAPASISGDIAKFFNAFRKPPAMGATNTELALCAGFMWLGLVLGWMGMISLKPKGVAYIMCTALQIVLLESVLILAGMWVEADTHAHMRAVRERMSGPLPYGSCLWHMAVYAIGCLAHQARPGQVLDKLAILGMAMLMRTLWLYRQARRERSHAEAAGKQQA